MAHAARPPARHLPNPSLSANSRPAPAPPPPTPAARRPDTPRRSAQDTPCITCVDGSGNIAPCQCKNDLRQNEIHQTNEATSRAKEILRTDSSDKLKTSRFSGGTYSKPDARVKMIPAEAITCTQHRKPYGRTVGSAGLQKRHCRRSVTPPPSSRKVSLVGSTSLTQKPMPSGSYYNSCLYSKRLETAENGRPFAVTPEITSLKNSASADCRSIQPSSTNLNTDAIPRNLDRMDSTKALDRSYSSSILHSPGQSSQKRPSGLPKEAVVNPVSPNPKEACAPPSIEDPLGKKQGPSSKSLCTSESREWCSRSINLTTRSKAAPVLQAPIVQPALLIPTSVLSERSIEAYPDTRRTAAPITQEPSVKPILLSPIPAHSETSMEVYSNSRSSPDPSTNLAMLQHKDISPTHSLQSMGFPQHTALSKERNLVDTNISIMHSPQSMAPAQLAQLPKERSPTAPIDRCRSSEYSQNIGTQETGSSVILHTKLHKKHYQSEACWKGNFYVTGELFHTCDELKAHFPLEICIRVYEASKQMPEILNLEAVPLSQLWPKKFKMKPPDSQDIGLWFISSHQRPHRSFGHLLEKISSHTGLLTNIGDTELAIFSSKLLTQHDQRKDGELYFWGVFGKRLRKKRRQPNSNIENVKISNLSRQSEDPCDRSDDVVVKLNAGKGKETENTISAILMTLDARGGEENEMGKSEETGSTMDVKGDKAIVKDKLEGWAKVLDLTGVKEADRVNDCMAVLGTADLNPTSSCTASAASLLNEWCSHDSANKSNFSLQDSACQPANGSSAGSDLDMLDTSPGFYLDVPPGFTKAHCQLPTGATAVSRVNALPSLLSDIPPGFPPDIPPGFTEAHRRPPASAERETEKKPLIRFSLYVPEPVRLEFTPGFTKLLAVKKEPGLPAVDKATEELAPSSVASAMRKGRKADETQITRDEVKVEQDTSESEEREIPKIRRLSDLYKPSDGPEVCRSVSADLPGSSQVTGPPEKQGHQRKRGQQELSEPSPADTTAKRPNTNGRIALNSAGALSSNQGQGNDNVR